MDTGTALPPSAGPDKLDGSDAADSSDDGFLEMCGMGQGDWGEVEFPDRAPLKQPLMGELERVNLAELTPERFAAEYESKNRPVIITNAEALMPMHMDLAYWRDKHGEAEVPLEINSKAMRRAMLGDYLTFDDLELNKLYMRNLHLFDWFPELLEEVALPPLFGTNHLAHSDRGYPVAWTRWFELFINTRDCRGFPFLHKDMCNTHAFSMQLAGEKAFVMFPPEDESNLYPLPSSSRSGIATPFIMSECVDLRSFPSYADTHPQRAVLRPGELLFTPSNWWHTTRVHSESEPSITLGGNFVCDTNLEPFLDSWSEFSRMLQLKAAGVVTLT